MTFRLQFRYAGVSRSYTLMLLSAILVLLAGCRALLPSSKEDIESPWSEFEQVKAAYDKIIPGKTGSAALKSLGFDIVASPNLQILNYIDVAATVQTIPWLSWIAGYRSACGPVTIAGPMCSSRGEPGRNGPATSGSIYSISAVHPTLPAGASRRFWLWLMITSPTSSGAALPGLRLIRMNETLSARCRVPMTYCFV